MPRSCIYTSEGPIIIGASPLGLAISACLTNKHVPFVLLEKSNCIASLWQKKTYDRLQNHLPKQFYELPKHRFPDEYPEQITREAYIEYLNSYVKKFEMKPFFNACVRRVTYDVQSSMWRVFTVRTTSPNRSEKEFRSPILVVATKGVIAQNIVPDINNFLGTVAYEEQYHSGVNYNGKNVLVVGCGNSGINTSLDLARHNANASFVTTSVVTKTMYDLVKWLPLWLLRNLVYMLIFFSFRRANPFLGPLNLRRRNRRDPNLSLCLLERIRTADLLKVVYGLITFQEDSVVLQNGDVLKIDSVILGARCFSTVPNWIQEKEFICGLIDNRLYTAPKISGAKGNNGVFKDAITIAEAIGKFWQEKKSSTKQQKKEKMM